MVKVLWEDAFAIDQKWRTISKAVKQVSKETTRCFTVGMVLEDTTEVLVVGLSISQDPIDAKDDINDGLIVIPKSAIKAIYTLSEEFINIGTSGSL